jgi:hypothetical protein
VLLTSLCQGQGPDRFAVVTGSFATRAEADRAAGMVPGATIAPCALQDPLGGSAPDHLVLVAGSLSGPATLDVALDGRQLLRGRLGDPMPAYELWLPPGRISVSATAQDCAGCAADALHVDLAEVARPVLELDQLDVD